MKRFGKIFALSVMALAALASCEKPEPQTPEKPVEPEKPVVKEATVIELDVKTIEFEAEKPAEKIIKVTADGTWTLTAPDWVTVTPDKGDKNGEVKVVAKENVAENTTEARTGELVFKGAEKVQEVVALSQKGREVVKEPEITAGQILFQDNFDWIKEWADAAGAGDAVTLNKADQYAPNVGTKEECKGFRDEFAKRGYADIDNGEKNVLYLQKYYLKFGKTSVNNGLVLPPLGLGKVAHDLTLEFDWTPQISTKRDKQDTFDLVVEITGEGTFENGKKITDGISVILEKGEDGLFILAWQHVNLVVKGAKEDTRLTVRPSEMTQEGKYYNRFYLDNFMVKAK